MKKGENGEEKLMPDGDGDGVMMESGKARKVRNLGSKEGKEGRSVGKVRYQCIKLSQSLGLTQPLAVCDCL